MALVLKDRVQETATANTTVSFTCTGAVTGFQAFSVIGNTNTTFYTATDVSGNWENGVGTYTTAGNLVTRTTVLASSNAGSAVTFSGTVNLFVSYPATNSINLDASGNASPLGTIASGTWQGSTIGVAYGGTGVTASSGANSVVLRDADQNAAINRINQSNAVTTSAAGTTILTAASSFSQTLVGTTVQTYQMPDATTLATGVAFEFNNNSTSLLTIQDYALATIATVSAGGAASLVVLTNATVAGTWDTHGYIPENVTWGTNALVLGGTVITGGTWQGGTIAYNYGGTGLTTFAAANNALYSTSASALVAGTLPVLAGGTGVTTSTGTGSTVLSASPTFTGTLNSADLAYTGTLTGGTGVIAIGTNQIYKDASGNVGIGTSSPQAKLAVSNLGASGFEFFINAPGGGVGTYIQSYNRSGAAYVNTHYYALSHTWRTTSSTTAMVLDASGNVGIGNTPSGTYKLEVTGAISGTSLVATRVTPRAVTTTSSATPTINTDVTDIYGLTAQAATITSFTTNLSGTPTNGQKLWIYIVGTGAVAITWGASFQASTIALPTTTVSTTRLDIGFVWNAASSVWRCVAVA